MDRRKLEQHLTIHGFAFHHHGGSHDTWWNGGGGSFVSVPRHREVKPGTVRSICVKGGIPIPREK